MISIKSIVRIAACFAVVALLVHVYRLHLAPRRPLPYPPGTTRDDAHRAALKIVWPLPSCRDSYLGGTVEACDEALEDIAQRRKKFATFEPDWMRVEIMEWLDFAERDARECREDCETRESEKSLQDYRRARDEEDKRAERVLDFVRQDRR